MSRATPRVIELADLWYRIWDDNLTKLKSAFPEASAEDDDAISELAASRAYDAVTSVCSAAEWDEFRRHQTERVRRQKRREANGRPPIGQRPNGGVYPTGRSARFTYWLNKNYPSA